MHWSKKYPTHTTFKIEVSSKPIVCSKCRKTIKHEPYAIRKYDWGIDMPEYEVRCWRCWHSDKITKRFMRKYPGMFTRVKTGRWYYLSMAQNWLIFPSSNDENVPA